MKNGKRDFEKAFIFAVLFATLTCVSIGTVSAAQTHYVNPGELIQWAIDNATAGDIIIVRDGTYTENVDVNVTNLTIKSENGSTCCSVQAASASDHVFEVTADFVNITGFTAKGATDYSKAGIYLDGVEHCEIYDNKASNNYYGIYLSSSSYNSLSGNIAEYNHYGIYLSSSSYNSLTGNNASNNYYGIYLSSSSYNSLSGNTTDSNNYYGIYLSSSSYNSLSGNTTDSNDKYGIQLRTSSNNSLSGNTANSNYYGIFLYYSSSNNTLTNNTANSNTYSGIYLYSSSNSTLNNNTMSGNTYNFGVYSGSLSGYTQNIDTSNTVDGKPVYYWINQRDKQIPDDAGYVGVVNSTNITVKDLTLSHNREGVLFVYTSNSRIENVSASNNRDGITLSSSCNNSLTNNTANSNNRDGIGLHFSSNNTLTSNTANSNNDYSIYLGWSSNNTLNNNTMSGNTYNFGVYSGSLSGYTQNIDTSNTVDGKTVYYWINQQDKQIPDDAGYVGVVNSTNITVKDLTLSHNREGVLFVYTTNSKIENVSASNNDYGIYLYTLSNNTLISNTVNSNDCGISLYSSSSNLIYNNYFNNTNNAQESGNNTWNITKTAGTNIIGGAYIGGNYWSDYAGEDTDGDGLGDTRIPYNSSGNIKYGGDYLPLVKASASSVFDTGAGTYPSIHGTHEGKIKPSCDIVVSQMYTYPCAGTGGHTRSIKLYENGDLKASGNWTGYQDDWQNIAITPSVTLRKGREYRYVIETGSYPQIIHVPIYKDAIGGTISCDKFTDVNGKVDTNWIPAIKLWS